MRFNAFYSEDLPAWLPGCLLLPSYPSFLPATIALTPSPPPPLLLAAHPLPFTLLPVNLASCLHFKLMDLPRKDKEGEPRERRQIYICVRILGKGKKRKKKRGKQVKRLCRLCLTYTLVQNRGFVYFFPASPSQSVHAPESSLQQAKFSMKFSWPGRGGCPRSRSTRRRIQKKRGLVCESRLRGYKPGWGRVQRKIRRAIFKRSERCLKFTLQVSRRGVGKRGVRFSRERRHKRYLLHFVNITNSMFQRRPILCSFS